MSKGFGLVHRFSEDIDIRIAPDGDLPVGPNHMKLQHIQARRVFYDGLARGISIPGFVKVERDTAFDDTKFRSAGIRLLYTGVNPLPAGVKEGVLLEAGFDQVAPNRACDISSWAYDAAVESGLKPTDKRAFAVPCYEPGYTLVEKLQTVSTKFRQQQASGDMPRNFMRHYYDIYCLLDDASVQSFIGADAYLQHKNRRFPAADDKDIARNEAFLLSDASVRRIYTRAYDSTAALYFRGQPPFDELIARIQAEALRL